MLGSDTGLDRWTAAIIIAGGLGLSNGGAIHHWFERLPYAIIQNSPDQAAFAAAVVVMLVATGNAIVRLALETVRVDLGGEKSPESKLAVVA